MFSAEMVPVRRCCGGLPKGRVRRGAVLIEAVIVLPVLLLLLFGIIEFGYCFYVLHTMKGAAWAGVRKAITPTATQSDVQTAVAGMMGAAGITSAEYSCPPPTLTVGRGAPITVTVTCTWGTVGVRPMQLISSDKTLRVEAVMLKE